MTDLAEKIARGNVRALARAATAVENRRPDAPQLLKEVFPLTGHATIIGVTGPPGAGKSTLVDQVARAARAGGQRVGIIAVDPTSPFTGGAILGDRLRMQAHAEDPGVFIRSMATRGQMGGLSRATSDAALVLDAAGKSLVIIETVGVGQDEIDIVRTADVSIVVLVPGTGDEVQALKAGISESVDLADASGSEVLVAIGRGAPLRVVYSYAPKLSAVFLGQGDKIKSCADLRGKKIGIQEIGGFSEVHSRAVMPTCGLTPKDVEYVTVSTPGRVPGLLAGRTDAVALEAALRSLLGVGDETGVEHGWALRRLLETLAAREPVVAALDDLHWASPALIDLVEDVARWTRGPVLVLSAFPEQDYALRALKSGASGYLTKQSASDELLAAIRKSLAGGKYVTASLAERLAEQLSGEAPSAPHEALSPRELQVLCLIATGKTVKEIAAELSLSEKTIGTYRTRISDKLRLSTNVEITRYALQHKLVD